MEHIKFNVHAFVAPSTKAEYMSLLDEAIRMANDLHDLIDGWKMSVATETSPNQSRLQSLA